MTLAWRPISLALNMAFTNTLYQYPSFILYCFGIIRRYIGISEATRLLKPSFSSKNVVSVLSTDKSCDNGPYSAFGGFPNSMYRMESDVICIYIQIVTQNILD